MPLTNSSQCIFRVKTALVLQSLIPNLISEDSSLNQSMFLVIAQTSASAGNLEDKELMNSQF